MVSPMKRTVQVKGPRWAIPLDQLSNSHVQTLNYDICIIIPLYHRTVCFLICTVKIYYIRIIHEVPRITYETQAQILKVGLVKFEGFYPFT